MTESKTTPEDLMKEWRDARQEWFDLTSDQMTKAAEDKVNVLRRLGDAESALMQYARTL